MNEKRDHLLQFHPVMPTNGKLLLLWCDPRALLYEVSKAANILFTEAKEPVTEAFPCPNTKLIGFRNSLPCHRCDISFINLNDLSSPLLLPCQSS